jgi:AcrR family transcriptional regulator
MTKKKPASATRREDALSRERIVEVAIEILDAGGERGLTFRALSERLATGAGALYWHVADKGDLLVAACDAIVARAIVPPGSASTPRAAVIAIAGRLFDAIDAHPWLGAALGRSAGREPMVRLVEALGQRVRALGVPLDEQWATTSALLHFIVGVAGQNAANAQEARALDADRGEFLASLAANWAELDPHDYPFARSIAAQMRSHDDRADFLAGVELILRGIAALRRR